MSKIPPDEAPRARPGGRSARVRAAVVAATVAELQENGYEQLSISAVAVRAGVHESSVYRRWKTRQGLAMEATFALFAESVSVPDKGSLLEDLVTMLSSAGRYLEAPLGRASMQFGLAMQTDAAFNDALHTLWSSRFEAFGVVFERAAERGEWPKQDSRPLLEALIGAVYLRVFLLRKPVTPKHVRPLVISVLSVASKTVAL